jgi:uncharacterized protein
MDTSQRVQHKRRRFVRRLLLLAVSGFILIPSLIFYVAVPYMDVAERIAPPRKAVCCETPANRGLDYENVWFRTSNNLNLYGWHIPTKNGTTIILAHSLSNNRLDVLDKAEVLAAQGYGALLFDLRAHGESEGEMVSVSGEDVLAALNYVAGRDDLDIERIGAYGVSLGAVNVLEAAAQDERIEAVMVEGLGMTALDDIPPSDLDDWPRVPYDVSFILISQLRGMTAPLSVKDAAATISPRPLFLVSAADFSFERRLTAYYYDAAGDPKSLWEVPGAWHAKGWQTNREEYQQHMTRFFDSAFGN